MKRNIRETIKVVFWAVAVLFTIFACSGPKEAVKIEKNEVETAAKDTVEYELETFDQQFESWYKLHDSPSQYRSKEYYEGWNQRYVSAWNYNATNPRSGWQFETVIGYDPSVDYGLELNHKLFYYFQYVENVLGIPVLSGGPDVVNF